MILAAFLGPEAMVVLLLIEPLILAVQGVAEKLHSSFFFGESLAILCRIEANAALNSNFYL